MLNINNRIQNQSFTSFSVDTQFNKMFKVLNRMLRNLSSRVRRRSKPKIYFKKTVKSGSRSHENTTKEGLIGGSSPVHSKGHLEFVETEERRIKIASFNAALFAMASAVPEKDKYWIPDNESGGRVSLRSKSANGRLKGILKQSTLHRAAVNGSSDSLPKQHKFGKPKLRVSIDLTEDEISLLRNNRFSFLDHEVHRNTNTRTIFDVLIELDLDVLALQEVKAVEERDMSPLSDLADALGMHYIFAESWAPQYGNAILSKWPIKRWSVQKIVEDTDFRNLLTATIDVPDTGELNFGCTHLDHLDENWRMKQIDAIVHSNNHDLHVLAGGLNSLDKMDYSSERWTDIVKYHEEMGKPAPKFEVMRFLKSKNYIDSKEFAGECEPVVMVVKGQNVQGTCKHGTRVDYILGSPNSPFKFVPGSYSVFSSKGTSTHHIVSVDVVKSTSNI